MTSLFAYKFVGTSRTTPFRYLAILETGQSLSLGGTQTSVSIVQPFNNVMLHDPSGTYAFNAPDDPALQLIPLVSPEKTPLSTGTTLYPQNILGESCAAMCNELTAIALSHGFVAFDVFGSCVGQGGAPIANLQRNSLTGNSYTAGIYELNALANKVALSDPGAKIFCVVVMHEGEQDSQNNITPEAYSTAEQLLQSTLETDIKTITGQAGHVPMFVTQQQSNAGSLNGPPSSSLANVIDARAQPRRIFLVGPKGQYPYAPDKIHLSNYVPMDKKVAQAIFQWLETGAWTSCIPLLPIARIGAEVSITFAVPVKPLVFDGTHPAPHGPGTQWSMWGPGKGLEYWDRPVNILGSTGNGVSPIVLQVDDASLYNNGDVFAAELVGGNTNANGVFFVRKDDSTHLALFFDEGLASPTTGNGSFLEAPIAPSGFSPIPILSAIVQPDGQTVVLTLGRTPLTSPSFAANALHSDRAWNVPTGGFPDGRCTLLRDSDPFQGHNLPNEPASPNPNYSVTFMEAVT